MFLKFPLDIKLTPLISKKPPADKHEICARIDIEEGIINSLPNFHELKIL